MAKTSSDDPYYAVGMFATPALDKYNVKPRASDGSTAEYYKLPENATQLQDLISYRNMNAQIGEAFRACYRYGLCPHSNKLREAKKIKFYAEKEIERLEKYG